MTDEETILALINGMKAMKVIDMHADDIAYGHATIWEACHPCRVRAAAWLRGTPPIHLPPPCKKIQEARNQLAEAHEAVRQWNGEKL